MAASLSALLACLLGGAASAQNPIPTLRPNEPLTVTLPTSVAPVATDPDKATSPVTVAAFTVTPEGPLTVVRVWADPPGGGPVVEPQDSDTSPTPASLLRLLLLDATTGTTVAEGIGERQSPFLEIETNEHRAGHVAITMSGHGPATATLHLRILHETAATLAAGRAAQETDLEHLLLETDSVFTLMGQTARSQDRLRSRCGPRGQ
jgi:hypothetical protein